MKLLISRNIEDTLLSSKLSELASVLALDSAFKKFLLEICEQTGFKQMSYCIELSTFSEDRGRLHIHAVFSNSEGRQDIGLPASWKFQGSTPDLRANSVTGRMQQ